MAKFYGYCYDENGKFTEIIPLQEKPKYEKVIVYRDEQKEVIIEEKICEFHKTAEEGIESGCIECVVGGISYVPIKVPYEEEVFNGEYEPIVPENCTLEVCPDLIYDPVFKDGKWLKHKPNLPPEPEPQPTELEKLKKQVELIDTAMTEFIMDQMLRGMK